MYSIYLVKGYGYNYVGQTSHNIDEYRFIGFKNNLKEIGIKKPLKRHFTYSVLERVSCPKIANIIEIKYIIREFFWHWNLNKSIYQGHRFQKGYKLSEETRKKISKMQPDRSGSKNPMSGKTHSEESRKKMTENRTDPKWEYLLEELPNGRWKVLITGKDYGRKNDAQKMYNRLSAD